MQHCQAAGIAEVVLRLATTPRRPSTNRMHDNRWLHFAHWSPGQGMNPVGPTAAQIGTFPCYLFDTHGLSPQAITGFSSYPHEQSCSSSG